MVDVVQTADAQVEAALALVQNFDGLLESVLQLAIVRAVVLETTLGAVDAPDQPLEAYATPLQTGDLGLEACIAVIQPAGLCIEAGIATINTSESPLEGNGNHVEQSAAEPLEVRVGVTNLINARVELVNQISFTAQTRLEAQRRAKLAPTLGFEGGIAAVQTAVLVIEQHLAARLAAGLRFEAPAGRTRAPLTPLEARGFLNGAGGIFPLETKTASTSTRTVLLERHSAVTQTRALPLELDRVAAPVNVVATARINVERRKFKGWHIESNNLVVQTAVLVIEARGLIIPASNTINFENGDIPGHFGIIRRLSNKSILLIPQRPTEGG